MSDNDEESFQQAVDWLGSSTAAAQLSNEAKLEIYGLYKCVTVGQPNIARPGFFSVAARAKYDAWVAEVHRYPDSRDAMQRYISIAHSLGFERNQQRGMGVRVSMMQANEETPSESMHDAVASGDLERVEFLLRNGQSANERDEFGNTPLHLAVDRGHVDMVRALLANGADLAATDADGQTPREIAEITGRSELAHILDA